MSIAGSDSSGGAGIQADLKTFSALGLYGTTVISTLTAQNTNKVSNIFVVPTEFFKDQLLTTIKDIQPDVIKIGVLFDKSIMRIVGQTLKNCKTPIIVDPVLISGTGSRLIDDKSFDTFLHEVVPLAKIITPNRFEAEELIKMKIKSKSHLKLAAKSICSLGAETVVIKGGHFNGNNSKITDYYYNAEKNETMEISNSKINIDETHGTGCNFSSALASYIAKGFESKDAFILANSYTQQALRYASKMGSGLLVANPLRRIYEQSEKFEVITELQKNVDLLNNVENFVKLIPETRTNFVYCTSDASTIHEVAGVNGRITGDDLYIHYPQSVRLGASKHMARALLSARKFNLRFRSAINIRNNSSILKICKGLFVCSGYDRNLEPAELKKIEGSSVNWGIAEAFKSTPDLEVVYHSGDFGKEGMIIIFAKKPEEVLEKIRLVLRKVNLNTKHYI